MLTLLLLFCMQDLAPEQAADPDWVYPLIQSRITRKASLLPLALFTGEGVIPGTTQKYLVTLGEIGDPTSLPQIEAYFQHPSLQETAIFAYGEVDGAPVAPLLALASSVKGTSHTLLFEALGKLAKPTDGDPIGAAWSQSAAEDRHRSIRFLWAVTNAPLAARVKAQLQETADAAFSGYVYYLARSKTKVASSLKAKVLSDYASYPEVLMWAARIQTEEQDQTGTQLAALARHVDWRVRVSALSGLANSPAPLVSQAGLIALDDPNPNVVRTALGLLVGLKDDEIDARLVKLGPKLSPSQVQTLLASVDPARLARYKPLIAKWPKDEFLWKRDAAFKLAGKVLGKKEILPIARYGESVNRSISLSNLAEFAPFEGQADVVREALETRDPYVMGAAMGLATPELADLVLEKLGKSYAEVDFHYGALDLLGPVMGDRSSAVLEQMLKHPSYLVRLKAATVKDPKDPELRKLALASGWRNKLPEELTELATELVARPVDKTWTLITNKGKVVIGLEAKYAPITVANIMYLTKRNYYQTLPIHRVVPNFVVQSGDSRGDGSGGPGHTIPCEVNMLRFQRGAVGMALSGKDTGGGQFFICHSAQTHLDGGYTIFGQVKEGMEVVDQLEEGDFLLAAQID